jgi:Protein of unknown function (DUF3352)
VTTSQPVASVPGWRIAIIVGVGLLAIGIGIAVGAFMLTARGSAIGSGASYVPASAPFYFEVRLEPSEAQDAALREFLGHFPEIEGIDIAQPLYPQLTAKLDEQLAAEGAEVSWAADVEPWFDGHVGLALLDLPDAALDPTTPETPPMPSAVVLLGMTDASVAQASIDRIIAASEMPVTFGEQEHAGVTIRVDEASGAAYALTDDQLLLAPAAADIVAALDAHASSATTLEEAGSIASLTDALPEEWLVFGLYDLTDLVAGVLEGGAAASPGADAMRDLLANQPVRGALAVTVDGDRISVPTVSDPPIGPLAVANAERGLADEVPGDALYYAEGGNVGASLSGLIGSLKEAAGSMPGGAEQLEMVESALGGDVEELVAWIGDAATVVGYDGEQPWGGAIIAPTSMEDARRTMDQLTTFAGLATLDPTIGITVEERDVEGVEVTSVRWSDPNAAEPDPEMPLPVGAIELVAEWAVTDDRVLIGFGDRFVERVLTLDASESLAEVVRYRDAVAELGGPNNAGVTWLDLHGVRLALEGAFAAIDPAALEVYETDIAPWLEPLDRLVVVARVEGEVLRSDSVLLVE